MLLYPDLHRYLRESAVPTLAVWGEGDQIFGPEGARAFGRDAVDPEIHLLEGGHFLLETSAREVAGLMLDFLAGMGEDNVEEFTDPAVDLEELSCDSLFNRATGPIAAS